jgi:hydroxymethylglutaryl-CoA lyase
MVACPVADGHSVLPGAIEHSPEKRTVAKFAANDKTGHIIQLELAVTSLPKRIHIFEEGPREGFQIEKGPIATARKIELIDALSDTGLDHIQIVSFVDPRRVPGMADAEEVVRGITPKPDVVYTGLWLNDRGFERAVATRRLDIKGTIVLCGSETFLKRNQNRSNAEQLAAQESLVQRYQALGYKVERGTIMAAFGCNFEGDVPAARIVDLTGQILDMAQRHGVVLDYVTLADTMAWATPASIKRVVGAVRERFPELELALHLHDTRGMGIANAYAGIEMGITRFDAAVAGLGGCPFAGHAAAAGNVCTEDLVFMCDEMGIETGIDLDALIECARLAEDIVGHPLPGSVMKGGSLQPRRARAGPP